MRATRARLAALLAVFGYLLITAVAPLLSNSSQPSGLTDLVRPVVSDAYADTASDQCGANYGGDQTACASGFRLYDSHKPSQTAQAACSHQPAGTQTDCQAGFNLAQSSQVQGAVSTGNGASHTVNQDTCEAAIPVFGWMACPAFDNIAQFVGGAAKDLMQSFLAVQPLQMGGPIYQTWSALRLLANVLFVVIFLVLIFAHVLNYEVDAYSIKKMIPKLVAGAILVQFSFVLSSAVIDVGNILGNGIGGLIGSATHQGYPGGSVTNYIIEDLTSVIAVGALISIAATSLILASPVFVMLLIAVLGFIVTLAVRYFLLGLLIVTSPLALAAWVLPNTESLFKKWLDTFIKLVLMYPIIMALLSVASDVGGLIPNSAGGGDLASVGNSISASVIKLLVLVACFGAVPATFKWAGGAMAGAYQAMSGLSRWGASKKWNSSGTQALRGKARERRHEKAERIQRGLERREGGYNFLGKVPTERARKWLAGNTLMVSGFSGAPTDRADRRLNTGSMVRKYSELAEGLDSAQDTHNIEKAMATYYLGEQAKMQTGKARENTLRRRQTIMNELRAADAEELLMFTSTALRREGAMNVLAKRNALKQPLLSSIQQTQKLADSTQNPKELSAAKHDQMAFMRQSFPLYGQQPFLSGVAHDGVSLKPNVVQNLRDLDATKIKSTFSDRNFAVMASVGTDSELLQAKEAAQMFTANVGADIIQQNFQHGGRNEMSSQKKMYALLAMARNEVFNSGNGADMKRTVVEQILHDGTDKNANLLSLVRQKAVEEATEILASQHPDWDEAAIDRQAQIDAQTVLDDLNHTGAGRLF